MELNAECIYREPGIKLDAGDKLILEHLTRIEGLLQNVLPTSPPSNGLMLSGGSASISNSSALDADEILARNAATNASMGHLGAIGGLPSWSNQPNNNFSSIPRMHTTPALHLLQWPIISKLVSRPCSPQDLLQLEMNRDPLKIETAPHLDLSNTTVYVQSFFEQVNVWYACVNPYNWASYYRTALSNGFRSGPESCIVLLVLALGNASTRGSISRLPPDEEPPGMPYFASAWGLLATIMLRPTILSSQCMILASAYLFYIVRPLDAWSLLSSCSMKLQLLLSNKPPAMLPTASRELSERVYWNTLLFER